MQVVPFDQRWRNRSEVRRTPGERIDPREYGVAPIGDKVAKAFVAEHHYSGSYPAAHRAVGLFRKTGAAPAALVGVAVFSEGVQSQLGMPRWTGFTHDRATELGRLVILPEVPYNGETWFLRRAFDAIREIKVKDPTTGREVPRFRAVLSYADPVERLDASGNMVKPGHFGTIYQASNAIFAGRASPRTLHVGPDGRVVHAYCFAKVSKGLRNAASAERAILAAGVPPRGPGEDVEAWVVRAKASLRMVRHPGNLAYVFGLDAEAKASVSALHKGGLSYPKSGKPPPRPGTFNGTAGIAAETWTP